ncbi:isoprenylcysteine carboxylmethyltransferase family protein [uncultured Chryseobacterium sp.]|uniref:methyltransferase family protein n=1 Tax=uncultured Chryseobacterium sp. TaxID=259322 RepID=UPI002587481C|nr:isoprenylcysteine carboxylmethyltransferase family protein [uncultured Chryseobacterium sp.]
MALRQELETQGNWLFRYRSFLPLIVIFIGLAVFIETNWNRSVSECNLYYEIICLLVSIFGLGIRIYTVGFTPKNTSGRNTKAGQVADELNTTGIYSIVRNPLYLGNFFMWLGLALFTENVWFIVSFILSYWIYYERIVFAEEQFLERKFGDYYIRWTEKVPPFIPNFSLFKSNQLRFSIRKVLLKEKNGLFAIFLIFTVFDLTAELMNNHLHFNNVFIAGCIATMLLYVVLKIIKRKKVFSLENNR